MKKKLKEYIAPILAVAGLYAVMEAVGITCPIKFLTGISCMGCGMSRAWMAVLRHVFPGKWNYGIDVVSVWSFIMRHRTLDCHERTDQQQQPDLQCI